MSTLTICSFEVSLDQIYLKFMAVVKFESQACMSNIIPEICHVHSNQYYTIYYWKRVCLLGGDSKIGSSVELWV